MAEYIPSPRQWVREQVELYERSGGTQGTTLRDTGLPVIIVTNTGNKTGAIRKTPLMRVKDGANYVVVGSQGGAPAHPDDPALRRRAKARYCFLSRSGSWLPPGAPLPAWGRMDADRAAPRTPGVAARCCLSGPSIRLSKASRTSSTPGWKLTNLYGPAPMGALRKPSSPTFSRYFFGTIDPAPGALVP